MFCNILFFFFSFYLLFVSFISFVILFYFIFRYTVKSSSVHNSSTDMNPEFSVERRYSDFVLLHKELGRIYPGAILPPLPKDQVFGRFKQEFIDSRMRALDDFLMRTHEHPDLADSPILKTFLTVAIFDESAILASEAVESITNSVDGTSKSTASKRTSWIDKIQNFNPTLSESQVCYLFIYFY